MDRRGSGQSESGRGAARAADNPIGLPKRRHNMSAFGIGQSSGFIGNGLHPQFCQAGPQYRSRCHDDRALHEVLQFGNITWPIMALDRFHHIHGDAVDSFALALGELSNKVAHEKRNIIAVSFPAKEEDGWERHSAC